MTTTEHAAFIRRELKRRHGWNSRQVSVRARYFSLGSSIDVEVKDAAVSLAAVKAIAEPHEQIHRCEITGEILGGGNTYLDVGYSSEALKILARRHADAIQRAVDTLPAEDDSSIAPIEGTPYGIGRKHGRFSLWDLAASRYLRDAYDVDDAAETVALNLEAHNART